MMADSLRQLFPEGMPDTLFFLSPFVTHGGNFCTINRIKSHLESQGFACHLEDPNDCVREKVFERRLVEGSVGVMVGIHALRTGDFMRGQKLPYILIIGGTDINVFCHDPKAMAVMTEAIQRARFIVCFSKANKERTLELWPDIIPSRLKVIPQAVHTSISTGSLKNYIPGQSSDVFQTTAISSTDDTLGVVGNVAGSCDEKPIVFVFVGGIRPVKNPLYLVETFQGWHARDPRIVYLMIGPRLDSKFAVDVFEPAVERSPGVVYVPGLPIADVHALVSQASALVNTSDSEGMCLALLEAMQLGIPVLARDIAGNRAIVQDGHTGLLFNSPQSFLEKAQQLLKDSGLRERLTREAAAYIRTHHSLELERQEYTRLLDQCLRDLHRQRHNGYTTNNNNNNDSILNSTNGISSGAENHSCAYKSNTSGLCIGVETS